MAHVEVDMYVGINICLLPIEQRVTAADGAQVQRADFYEPHLSHIEHGLSRGTASGGKEPTYPNTYIGRRHRR